MIRTAGWRSSTGRPAGCATCPTAGSRPCSKDRPTRCTALVDWAHRGPAAAAVTGVAVREERPEGLGDFVIR
jgi:hypothetical protein